MTEEEPQIIEEEVIRDLNKKPFAVDLESCGYYDNVTLSKLMNSLSSSSKDIGLAIVTQMLFISETFKIVEREDFDNKKLELYVFIIQGGFEEIRSLISSRIIVDYYYQNLKNIFQELSEFFPDCGNAKISELQEFFMKYFQNNQQGGTQIGGKNKVLKLFMKLMVALWLLLISASGELELSGRKITTINPNQSNNFNSMFGLDSGIKPKDSQEQITVTSDTSVELTNCNQTMVVSKKMTDAVNALIKEEVKMAIKNNPDSKVNKIYGKTRDLGEALVDIIKAGKATNDVMQKYNLNTEEQNYCLDLVNRAGNDYATVMVEQTREINALLMEGNQLASSLIDRTTLSLKQLVNTGLDTTKDSEQVILSIMVKDLNEYLTKNGINFNDEGNFIEEPKFEQDALDLSKASASSSASTPEYSLFNGGMVYAYGMAKSLVGRDTAKAIADYIASPEAQAQASQYAKLQEDVAKAADAEAKAIIQKRVDAIDLAKKNKAFVIEQLSTLAQVGLASTPVQFSYDSASDVVEVHINKDYRLEILDYFQKSVVGPLLEKAKQANDADRANWISSLSNEDRARYESYLAIDDQLTFAKYAMQAVNGVIAGTYQIKADNESLFKTVIIGVSRGVQLFKDALSSQRPLRNLELARQDAISKEKEARYEEESKQMWKKINDRTTAGIRGALSAVKTVTREGAYGAMSGILGTFNGVWDAISDNYRDSPYGTILAASFGAGIIFLLLYMGGVVTTASVLLTTGVKMTAAFVMPIIKYASDYIAISLGVCVSYHVFEELRVRVPELIGTVAESGTLTQQEQYVNYWANIIFSILSSAGIGSGCDNGVCFSAPNKTQMVFILGGLVIIILKGRMHFFSSNKSEIASGTTVTLTSAAPVSVVTPLPEPASSGQQSLVQGDLTTPLRRMPFSNQSGRGGKAKAKVKTKSKAKSNKIRNKNKTKKPKRSLRKNEKAKSKSKYTRRHNKKTKPSKKKKTVRNR